MKSIMELWRADRASMDMQIRSCEERRQAEDWGAATAEKRLKAVCFVGITSQYSHFTWVNSRQFNCPEFYGNLCEALLCLVVWYGQFRYKLGDLTLPARHLVSICIHLYNIHYFDEGIYVSLQDIQNRDQIPYNACSSWNISLNNWMLDY